MCSACVSTAMTSGEHAAHQVMDSDNFFTFLQQKRELCKSMSASKKRRDEVEKEKLRKLAGVSDRENRVVDEKAGDLIRQVNEWKTKMKTKIATAEKKITERIKVICSDIDEVLVDESAVMEMTPRELSQFKDNDGEENLQHLMDFFSSIEFDISLMSSPVLSSSGRSNSCDIEFYVRQKRD